jgi:Receptor family ligand binding region
MILLSTFRFEAFLLSCYFGLSFQRSCHAEQQPSLRGTVLSPVSGNDQEFQDMILSHPQKLRRREEETNNTVFIAGLFDTNNFDWIEIFNFTMTLIQERNGWHDDILGDENIKLEWAALDSACDEATALQAYWSLKTAPHALHGVVGTRCSDSSIAIARITGLENVPQVSPSATASTLSDKVNARLAISPCTVVLVSDQNV